MGCSSFRYPLLHNISGLKLAPATIKGSITECKGSILVNFRFHKRVLSQKVSRRPTNCQKDVFIVTHRANPYFTIIQVIKIKLRSPRTELAIFKTHFVVHRTTWQKMETLANRGA